MGSSTHLCARVALYEQSVGNYPMARSSSRRRRFGVAALFAVLLVSSAACSSGSNTTTQSSGTPASGSSSAPAGITVSSKMESLTVAIPTRAAGTSSDVPVAIVKGFFKAHHLDVTLLDGLGSNVANVVTSGQADIGYLSDAGPLTIAQKGKATTIIRALHVGGVA